MGQQWLFQQPNPIAFKKIHIEIAFFESVSNVGHSLKQFIFIKKNRKYNWEK